MSKRVLFFAGLCMLSPIWPVFAVQFGNMVVIENTSRQSREVSIQAEHSWCFFPEPEENCNPTISQGQREVVAVEGLSRKVVQLQGTTWGTRVRWKIEGALESGQTLKGILKLYENESLIQIPE